jgi:serine/threonine protein kinase
MGDVHRAVHHLTGQRVALKIMKAHVVQSPGSATRFLREVQAAATIDHPGVVQVFDAGTHENTLYIAMELLEGESLRERLGRGVSRYEALLILRQVLDPLAEAHRNGIIHRDLKPDNVFVAGVLDETVVKLLDFGIASDLTHLGATQTGLTVGTPHYMSPEQGIDPRTCTSATDVWAMGVMLYEVLAGKLPFDGVTAHGVLINAMNSPHPDLPKSVEVPLRKLVDRCLRKDQRNRPRDATALAVAFDIAVPDLERLTNFTVRIQRPRLTSSGSPPRLLDVLPRAAEGSSGVPRDGAARGGTPKVRNWGTDVWPVDDAADSGFRPPRRWTKLWLVLGVIILMGLAAFLAVVLSRRDDQSGTPAAGAPASAAPTAPASAAPTDPASAAPAAPDSEAPTDPDSEPFDAAATPASENPALGTPGKKRPGRRSVNSDATRPARTAPAGHNRFLVPRDHQR